MIDNPEPMYIGTPRRNPQERARGGDRSRSSSIARGRRTGVQRPLLDIPVTAPSQQTTPTIKNIGLEEIRLKRQASSSRSASEPAKAKAKATTKPKAGATLMIADAEPAKKREADDILGAAEKKKFIKKDAEVNSPPPIKSKGAAPPPDRSAAASSSGPVAKPKAAPKPRGAPKKEPRDTSVAPVSK